MPGLPPSPSPYGNQPGKTVYKQQTRGRGRPAGAGGTVAPYPTNFGDDHSGRGQLPQDPVANKAAQKAHTTDLQRFLVNHGYQIAIDGVMGPQTQAAAKFFRDNHIKDPNSGKTWSAAQHGTTGPKPPPTKKAPATRTVTNAGGTTAPAGGGIDLNALLGLGGGGEDPNALALAMTNAEYGQPIGQARRNYSHQQAQTKLDSQQIEDWFSGLSQQNDQQSAEADKALQAMLGSDSQESQNLLASITDPAARAQLANTAQIGRNYLTALGVDQHDYNGQMGTKIAQQGRDSLTNQLSADRGHENDLLGALNDLITQRGQKLVANQTSAREQLLKDKAEKANLAMTMAQFPGQLKGQRLDLASKALGIQGQRTANATAATQLKLAAQQLSGGGFTQADRMTLADGLIGDLQKQVPVVDADGVKTGKYQHNLAGVRSRVSYVKQKLRLAHIDTRTPQGKAMALAILRAGGGGTANPDPKWFN